MFAIQYELPWLNSQRSTIWWLPIVIVSWLQQIISNSCFQDFTRNQTCVHSSFAIILQRKRKLDALLLLSYRCISTINVLWHLLTELWVGLQYVIVVFPDHTHLLFDLP